MNTHDIMAWAVAQEVVRQTRAGDAAWSGVFSPSVHATLARTWPLPDFVVVDSSTGEAAAAEFKPPDQTKREYLTGLGQSTAYTNAFNYSLLVVPDVADDDFRIGEYLADVLNQDVSDALPIGLIQYPAKTFSPSNTSFTVLRPLKTRQFGFTATASIENSFYAKWREASAHEIGRFVDYLYEEGRIDDPAQNVRDRAFARLWMDMTSGQTLHWGGAPRQIANAPKNEVAYAKNYRNFLSHLGWILADGRLTAEGLEAHRVLHIYGADSTVFLDHLATAVLGAGKHLVLINAINQLQDQQPPPIDEPTWLSGLEQGLENQGLLKRNPGRHAAAVQASARGFLKAEKQLWRQLRLIVPRQKRVFHPGRGFIFDWERITALVST